MKKVLLVDDHDDGRRFVKLFLEVQGYEVVEAADGPEAVEMARQHCPDVILLDIALPGLDGFQAFDAIRQIDTCENTPIIALTAFAEIAERTSKHGFCDLVKKPIDLDRLLNIVVGQLPARSAA